MSKRKFKKGDNIIVIKGKYKGMRGTIDACLEGDGRVRYRVKFESFTTYMHSYQLNLDVERTMLEKAKEEARPMLDKINREIVEEAFKEDESAAIKRMVESIGNHEKPKVKPGTSVMLSKRGLARIYIDGIVNTGHSYEWVRRNNFHKIDRVTTFGGINFYTLVGFNCTYHLTDEDLLCPKYEVGKKVCFTRETLVKLGVELSQYYRDDTINKLPQNIIGPRKVTSIGYEGDNVIYQLDGECFGKAFYEHEIEPAND